MGGVAYYNEIDLDAAAVLRELIARGVIAPGDVDTRSIKDVRPDDLRPYTQCHFFAGGGLWSVAARLAGWPDDRSLWTGSCPCQPFSVAGKGFGTDDPRHLWPDFYRLIRAGRPPVVMGEQVAGKAGRHWFHGVCTDLASGGYAGRAVDVPACAVDAPIERNRIWWIAVAEPCGGGCDRGTEVEERQSPQGASAEWADAGPSVGSPSLGWGEGRSEHEFRGGRPAITYPDLRRVNGSWWADAEWITCPDGKARRTKPRLSFLVDGLPGRVGLWRIGGNAISPVLAAEVMGAFMDAYG